MIDGDSGISKSECRQRALSGDLFSPRTTRYFFPFRKSDISLDLSQLEKGTPVDVSHLIAGVDVSEEIFHNKKYIEEINEEIDIVIRYLAEVSETKEYLNDQILKMGESKEVAFFPGKFHPPHFGHIITILHILPKYKKLILGVSGHVPKDSVIATQEEIIGGLEEVFQNFENVEVCTIKGTLTDSKSVSYLPEFDILLSGNPEVLSWAKKMNINVEYVPRSEGVLFSGHKIRSILGG